MRAIALAASCATLLAGCESTQDTSRRLAREGRKAFAEHGLSVTRQARNVKVVSTIALSDQNGSAAVVQLRNESAQAVAEVPIAIDVRAGASSVFKNNAPGIEPSLTHVASIPPHGEIYWVNDQVTASGVTSVVPTVGAPGKTVPSLPQVVVSQPTLTDDPVSGTEADGTAENRSSSDQLKMIVYCVALKGSKVVAAGRGEFPRLRAGKSAQYHIFFIGDPHGARLLVQAAPNAT